jgi:hypothetical protein
MYVDLHRLAGRAMVDVADGAGRSEYAEQILEAIDLIKSGAGGRNPDGVLRPERNLKAARHRPTADPNQVARLRRGRFRG